MINVVPGRRRIALGAAVFVALGGAALLQLFDANPAVSQTAQLLVYNTDTDPGLDPNAKDWGRVSALSVPLTAQAATYATGGGSVPAVSARALQWGDTLYVRLEWADTTKDESTTRVQDFADGAAIEFPSRSAATVPSVCMGQADAGVNIWQWRADFQAGGPELDRVYKNASVDAYPSKDEALWYPARALGNPVATTGDGGAAALVARAFGGLEKASTQDVKARGEHANGKWAVVFSRPFANADPEQASFAKGATTDMAFAVWNGSEGDRNGRKSVSQFVTLNLRGAAFAQTHETSTTTLLLAVGTIAVFVALGGGLAVYGYGKGRREG
jgi:complex iron-sulfur molybdoenzyme family reductase subunit gamma